MGTLKKSPKSELSTEEVARGRLPLLSCATQVWKSELPSFLSRSTPSFVESKGVYVIFESAYDLEAELSKLGIEKVDKPCKEAAQGRLMIWRRRLSKSPTGPTFFFWGQNKGSTCYCQIDSDIGLGWDQTRIHQHQLLYMVITMTLVKKSFFLFINMLSFYSDVLVYVPAIAERANIGIAVASTTDAARGASDIHLTKP
ncbi:hypothetical protein F2Q68_00043460 [Brassica cretica]|uniref:Uncharacterized protein n=1 Tax=Brassica cretica TaxID=69181 RepID=A0A8S9LRV2_BRACR|nr:hypothetical protein F2Q68_00043460 [Brassica cretica]